MTASAPPHTDPQPPGEANVMPVVARSQPGVPTWAIIAIILVLGAILFVVLDARRRTLTAPAVRPGAGDGVPVAAAPPPLYVPPVVPPPAAIVAMPVLPPAPTPAPPPAPAPVVTYVQQPIPEPQPAPAVIPPSRIATEATLVIDNTTPGAVAAQAAGAPAEQNQGNRQSGQAGGVAGGRASAGVLANRATTIPQGTLIPAILETALDSTRPGLARALVSRDVRGFDGTRILVPRGSRLIGEYGAQIESGQNRLLVNWIRLIRPDGATVAIGSPAADPMGNTGIRASVNSHFFERFAGAILQSALDVGVNLASRSVDSGGVVLLPGTQSFRPQPTQIRPTLRVKPATSISIFVARDLDFTSVEAR
ncbi:TrbI/VirB10 family protein [Sphingomonas sp. DG1-23]|jgi:type IV secretion system protein VirB10|uniref:TrbI/VirB10 family protein n=1 Tax=Sphingomonas sp. DG1-23 TaxID=3068316 RepID=UPI00273DFA20|nr:TrbI/VirB10 family protein [Sphingomonas sp. DG1-23]MDP5278249.1 TrbI/VirB10 family protein [Sphingomonas sp. DG1-23]